jgi:hypothetical protein
MRFNKDIHLSRNNDAFRLGFSVVAANLLNHTNFTGVNGIFPEGTAALAAATPFPNGGNLLNGPYNLRGVKALDFNGTVPGVTPLAFNSADVARQIQFGLRVSF